MLGAGDCGLERVALARKDVAVGGEQIDLLIDLAGLLRQGRDLLLDEHLPPPPAIGLRDGIQPGFLQELGPTVCLASGRHLLRCRRR